MRPSKAPAIAPHRSPGQQSASLRHVPVPAPAADEAQVRVPLGLTRQLSQPTGHGVVLQTVEHASLTQTPAAHVPHEVNPHLAASFPGPQATEAHCGVQQLSW